MPSYRMSAIRRQDAHVVANYRTRGIDLEIPSPNSEE
jgi:hypothetical protein